ncbi:hypothetical protein [Flavobacterium silvaticum]|uniref:Uncharacterized protein n=1 Tax=Flavobacterium silvaticum TaxID=1852020 RepID=A0A972G086_9FLAO|nr:hypothetical protein [Flavobacterium silvaticum]NMH28056.1 hypothetical protein [Flavobacterium silvaticum]
MKSRTEPLALVPMTEVARRISLKDSEAAKRWCLQQKLSVHRFARRDFVYEFDLEFAVTKPFVLNLQLKHPNEWLNILKDVLDCDVLYNYFLLNLEQTRNDKALAIIEPLDAEQDELLKRLLR